MSYVGKILVVLQVVLSLLFMAFAGAVFAIHDNWRTKHEATQQTLDETQNTLQVVQEELTTAKRDHSSKMAAAEARANEFQAKNATLSAQIANLQETNNQLETQRETQTGLAESKGNEAKFRQEEAEKQRIENEKLQTSLDAKASEVLKLKDELFTFRQTFKELEEEKLSLEEQTAFLQKVVAAEGLETDPRVVEKLDSPPPPVDGIVAEVRKNRANRVQFVEITIGSDDGLVKGHQLDVYRVSDQSAADWLGKIRVVDVFSDSAVGEVILPAKNGIIQKGDNVTSKLR